jgi:surface antigen
LLLSGCASHHADDYAAASPPAPVPLAAAGSPREMPSLPGQRPLQCVPYAREHSQVKLYGDAWTWWDQAAGKYERGLSPASGSVMVLHNYAGPKHGHLAVVRRIVSAREIRIDHANWLNDGSIYVNNPVVDVSAANDWSQVRVFNIQTGAWGGKTYPVKGFIGSGSNSVPDSNKKPIEEKAPEENIDALIAELAASPPVRATALRSAPAINDRNPPANSPYALTADDLAIE